MAQKLSRRRYAEITKFLNSTIRDSKISHRVRMAAAARLDALYARNEEMSERAEVRREAREKAEQAASSLPVAVAPSAPPDYGDDHNADSVAAKAFLNSMKAAREEVYE
jgi:hypothetical protein